MEIPSNIKTIKDIRCKHLNQLFYHTDISNSVSKMRAGPYVATVSDP